MQKRESNTSGVSSMARQGSKYVHVSYITKADKKRSIHFEGRGLRSELCLLTNYNNCLILKPGGRVIMQKKNVYWKKNNNSLFRIIILFYKVRKIKDIKQGSDYTSI